MVRPVILRSLAFAACALVALGGCAGLAGGRSPAQNDKIVADTDWAAMRDVHLVIKDYGYHPREIRFKAGVPYKLVIENQGVNNHYFVAPEFFRAVAPRKAEVPRYAEFKADQYRSFELFAAGGWLEFWFVPVDRGTYRAHCHLGGHAEMGVEGIIVIE